MAVEDSVARDQLRAFIERIERMENEKAAIAADIKEIYAEAKGNGFDTKILRKIVTIRKQDANERMEQEAILELYMGALGMTSGSPSEYERTDSGIDVSGIDPDLLSTLIEGSKTDAGLKVIKAAVEQVKAGNRVAALRADPAMSIVDAAHIKSKTQSAPQAGRDLTTPATPEGQVAPNPVAKAADDVNSGSAMSEVSAAADAPEQAEVASRVAGGRAPAATSEVMDATAGETAPVQSAGKPVEASASAAPAATYADPGIIVWESAPPEGVERHEYSLAFGEFGQDIAVIEDDLAGSKAQPIVKIGKVILDGWARYMMARSMIGLDGKPIEYPVVQYDGADPLLDCIRWNMDGRLLSESQKRAIAQRLCRIEPKRKADIFKAMDMGMELVA